MEAQKPARGISIESDEAPDFRVYRVNCECGSDNHEHVLIVEVQDSVVEVSINTTEHTDHWTEALAPNYELSGVSWHFDLALKNLVNGFLRRVKLTWQLWRHGHVKYSANLVLNRQAALNYAQALQDAVLTAQDFADQQQSGK